MFGKEEFEKRLEEIGKKLKERARLEERLREAEKRIGRLEELTKSIEPAKVKERADAIEKEFRSFESRISGSIEELNGRFELLSASVRKDVENVIRKDIEKMAEKKLMESYQEVSNRIAGLERKISVVEERINKLLEILEAVS